MKTLAATVKISGTRITIPFRVICSVTTEPFNGLVVITYVPREKFVEYVSCERAVGALCAAPTTAEALARAVFDEVAACIDV